MSYFDFRSIEGADFTLYDEDGNNITMDFDALTIAVMLKAIGFHIDGDNMTHFAPDTLNRIMNGEVNPFTLVTLSEYEKKKGRAK